MERLIIFSDVHKQKNRLEAILKEHMDATLFISLGDTELKSSFLEQHDIIAIKGNYPFDAGFTYEHEMTIENKKFLFVHGHKYGIRHGIEKLYERMLESNIDFAFYGHTHVAAFDTVENRYLINPGAVYKSRSEINDSYIVFEIDKDHIEIKWLDAINHTLIEHKEFTLK
ncbi:MAG: metallophosphoesterase family protein [Candidatus Izemoplasmataceae bacterium]